MSTTPNNGSTMTPEPFSLAIDAGPLYGHRTGVGVAAEGMIGALCARSDLNVDPYVVSRRATTLPGHQRLPIPGIAASHLWSRSDWPNADRWFGDIDVVHGTNYVAPPSRHPAVVSVYDCWFLKHPELASPMVRRAGKTLRRAVARGAWIHTTSDAIANEAKTLLNTDRVSAVALGGPSAPPPLSELARPAIAETIGGRPFLLTIATEERRKDITLLIDAFSRVAGANPEVLLVLAGAPGNSSNDITVRIDQLDPPLQSRIHRLGTIDEATKHWLLRQAALLAYPSLDEGFGFPILEAHASGTPVVARAVGSIPEVAGEAAVLVADRDSGDLAEALERVLNDGALRLGLIEAGNRNVERFDWHKTAVGLVALYRQAIEAQS